MPLRMSAPTNPLEFVDARSTEEKLAPLVKQTGGYIGRMAMPPAPSICRASCRCAAGATMAGSDWLGIRMTDASVLKGITRIPLFTGSSECSAWRDCSGFSRFSVCPSQRGCAKGDSRRSGASGGQENPQTNDRRHHGL